MKQKHRSFNPERYAAINEEVKKLVEAGSVREAYYPDWLANVVLVKKTSGKWRVCTDFTDLNRACPKDCYPLPRVDQLVDATSGHQLLSFMDAYSGYNQIQMHPDDEEKTAFVTSQGLYCYKVMPFGLKNAGATYQRLVNKMFCELLGKTMEVYVDDMLVKSLRAEDHIQHLKESFEILNKYRMRLNPSKCAFGVASGKFLGFMVHHRGIEANPEKIRALLEMKSPVKIKDVQRLTGCIASLNRFIARATDRSLPFFKTLRRGDNFAWTDECEHSFRELKIYLGKVPLLSKPAMGEALSLYLAVSGAAVSAALVRNEESRELPVFYVSRALADAETRYPDAEKIALALVVSARKLRPYFQSHTIVVYSKAPLRQILQNPECSGRLAKWSIELSEFDIQYRPRTAIKGQAVADFLLEFINPEAEPGSDDRPQEGKECSPWTLFVDGSCNKFGSGAGVVLKNPSKEIIARAFKIEFPVTNNEAEYEALVTGLRMAKDLDVRRLAVFCDSKLVVGQITASFEAKEPRMRQYSLAAMDLSSQFESCDIQHIPREANAEADRLARIGSGIETDPSCTVTRLVSS